MAQDSTPNESMIRQRIEKLHNVGLLSSKYFELTNHFYEEISHALKESRRPTNAFNAEFFVFLELLEKQLVTPFSFEPYHPQVRKPIDYYTFGLSFIRPLIDLAHSTVWGHDELDKIERELEAGENVILFANHQTETDPQVISILLEPTHAKLAEKIIYVAGERVITDPLAVPFSMGCNLICIYSKRYIDHPPGLKEKKLLHNKQTMAKMSELLSQGGKIIYVAPSGGRDRKNAQGTIEVAPFDPQSIEMFYLCAKKSKKRTHFYPLTLFTYPLLPPPDTIQIDLGEKRHAQFSPTHISFSVEFDMELYHHTMMDKEQKRQQRSDALWNIVNREHERLLTL